MPFPFLYVCDLLEALQDIWTHDPPFLPNEAERISKEVIERWFVNHRRRIDNETDGLALLSTLLPEKRPDRAYMLQANSLEKLVGRALALPNSRRIDLERWRQPGAGDLGDCVERVQKHGETVTPARAKDISIEDIDNVLLAIASRSRFSSPGIKAFHKTDAEKFKDPRGDLGVIFSRLQARESKWLTRLVLKTYAPVVLAADAVFRLYNHLLPSLLKVQNELPAALCLLASLGADSSIPTMGDHHYRQLDVLKNLKPLIGVKVGRPFFFQGRGIKHCIDMAQNRRMSVEKKYDGEYFQLHVDMSKAGRNRIKIFSKNGRDSTKDRIAVHSIIQQCLGLDQPYCEISTMCILEGELLVYSDKDNKILDFHKIRKHVSRSGSFLGVHMDSQPQHFEHLMLMFFDILALDDGQVLGLKQYERRRLLERVVRRIPGRADLAECQIIRFSSPGAATELRTVFAKCIAARGEGLVIKPADEPYFNFENSRTYRSCCIKLKKEAFGAFGDVGDFAIVGAAYDSVRAKTYKIPSLQWTDFYIGCLENKDGVSKANVKPRFVVVTTVSLSQQILEALVHTLHIMSLPYGNNDHFDLRLENGINQGRKPSVIFSTPPVVDLRCFAFDKEGNTGFWTMRFPAVTKLHADRTFMDTISFVELQQMAETHRTMPEDEAAEELRWIRLLEAADLRGVAVDASTQYTSSSAPTTPTLGGRLLENSGQHQAFLIREDAAEKQQQVADRDAPIADPPPLTGDHFPSSSDSVGSPVMIERRSASLNSSTIENMGQSSKRTRDARSESPVQHQKRQRVSKSMKSSSYLAIEIHPVTPPTLSRPLSNITNSSLKPCTSPKLGKWLSTIQKNTSEAATNQCKELLTKTKNSPANGSPYPTPYDIDGSSSALRGNQAIGESAPIPRPSNLLETSVRRNPKVVADTWKGNSICQQASASCLFVNCSFLLAPCVGGMPLLTEDLLPSHGARFILDPSLWLDSDAFPRRCSFSRHKTRKLVLVEPRRIQETVKMFKAIQNLNLVRGDGRREWVEVYDFRIVECVSKMEMDAKARYNLWRHFWIGAA